MKTLTSLFAALFVSAVCHGVDGIAETSEDMTSHGDWEVTVSAGESNVVVAAQGGAGRIIKKGEGYLVLRKNSTFTGGVEIREGFVLVDPDSEAGTSGTVNSTALGIGPVTVCGQTDYWQGYCELGIVGAGSNDTRIVTIANDINVTGTSSGAYPALTIYGQNVEITGKITAAADFVFIDDLNSTTAISKSQWNRWQKVQSCTFGEIEAAGSVGFSGLCRMAFKGKVKTPRFDLCIQREMRPGDDDKPNQNNMHGALVFHAVNEIGEIIDANRPVYCAADNVLPGTIFRPVKRPDGLGLYTFAFLYTHGYDNAAHTQTMGGLAGDPLSDGEVIFGDGKYEWQVRGLGGRTLTITGAPPDDGADSKELVTSVPLNGSMSLEIDAYDGFTQTVSNQTHSMDGTIKVKRGGFRVAGTARFSAVKEISVGESASLDIASTNEEPFPSLKSISVDGILKVSDESAGCNPLDDVSLSLGANARLTLPQSSTQTVEVLFFNGKPVLPGVYTAETLPCLNAGATLLVFSIDQGSTAVWTGAADGDNLMGTLGNWQGPPESIDIASGALGVTVAGDGDEMVYGEGTMVNGINFTRTAASTPFTIRPATKDASLTVVGKMTVKDAAQIVLSGTIATPNHMDQGAPARDGAHTMYIYIASNDFTLACSETNNVYMGGGDYGSLPVVLDNVTIEKPVYSLGSNLSGFTLFYCMPNTTNEIKGAFHHQTWWPYITVDEGASLAFSGGMSSGILVRKHGQGTMVIRDKPLVSESYFGVYQGTLTLDAENISLRGTSSGEGLMLECNGGNSKIDCRRSYCLNGDCALMIYGNNSPGIVELNSTTQRVTRLAAVKNVKGTQMRGNPGSLLEVVGGRTDMTFTMTLLTNRVDIAGALSFRLCATNETMTFYSQDFSTVGDLEVSAGTLDMRSDATWLNGTNVTVSGEGRLKIGAGKTFNGRFAELDIGGGGVFEIPAGVSQKFRSVCTNGVALPAGRYASLPNGDGDFIDGGGEIVVPMHGTVVSVR